MLSLLFVATLATFPSPPASPTSPGISNQEHGHAKSDLPKKGMDSPEDPSGALSELKAGNARFVAGKRTRTLETAKDPALREQLAKGQAPFAVLITCADSRVPDALLFDQEMGRLFVIREAGNAPDLQGIASVDYAIEHLGSKVVVVMGHSSCGAVKAVMESNGNALPGNLWVFQAGMAGLLETNQHDPNEASTLHLTHLVEANAKRQAQALLDRSEAVRKLVSAEKIWVVPAVYDLGSGKVQFFKAVSAAEAPAHH